MERPTVINMRHRGDFDYDVRVDRATKWGNPFKMGMDGTREEVIEKYAKWIVKQPELMAALPELAGKRIACWCTPLPCHADVLADLVEGLNG